MPNFTPNYGLTKPIATENYDVAIPNANMDLIDSAMAGIDLARLNGDNAILNRGAQFCKIQAVAVQSIPNTTVTAVSFAGGSVLADTNTMADIPNSGIRIKKNAYYRFTAIVNFATNATGYRVVQIYNATVGAYIMVDHRMAVSGLQTHCHITSEPVACNVNDLIILRVAQLSGAALNLDAYSGIGYSSLTAVSEISFAGTYLP